MLPASCPRLRKLTWYTCGTTLTVQRLLQQLTATGVLLEELELIGPCSPGLLASASEHPLQVLRIDELAAEGPSGDLAANGPPAFGDVAEVAVCRASVALPAALLRLMTTLTDLSIQHTQHAQSATLVLLPLWSGLRRLRVTGPFRVVGAAAAVPLSLRYLNLTGSADCEWEEVWAKQPLGCLHTLRVHDVAARTFAAVVRDTQAVGDASTSAALPALRNLSCGRPVSLDRVLRLWPRLARLVACNSVAVRDELIGAVAPPSTYTHTGLRRLSIGALHGVLGLWLFPNLARFGALLEGSDEKLALGWTLIRRCLTAAATTLHTVTFSEAPKSRKLDKAERRRLQRMRHTRSSRRQDRLPQSDNVAATVAHELATVGEQWPAAFPKMRRAVFNFGVGFDANRPWMTTILDRALSLTTLHVRAPGDGRNLMAWLAALGCRGAFANLQHFHCDLPEQRSPDSENHLRVAVPSLCYCGLRSVQ